MNLSKNVVLEHLQNYIEPYSELTLGASKAIKVLEIAEHTVQLSLVLAFPAAGYAHSLRENLLAYLKPLAITQLELSLSWEIVTHLVQGGLKPQAGIKNIIAVASGKGGVGKSTTAVNLALALQAEGAHVGILDADIYGPNQPKMLGISQKPEVIDGKIMRPIMSHGLQSMSIGYLVDQKTPMVWRGPMVSSALQQLLHDTAWEDLDYLIIDLPPGTGDVQLTLAQKIPVSGALVVTTPQDIALLDVHKAIGMFQKVHVPILGVIENMSMHICSQCGHQEALFGSGGGELIAEEYNAPLLGQLPLDIRIRQQADAGNPIVAVEPDGAIALAYRTIARKLAAKLSGRAKNFSQRFPKITIEK